MPLAFSLGNIGKFATFMSPIFISGFLLVTSAMEWNLKGPVYLIGLTIAYFFGLLLKALFLTFDGGRLGGKWSRKSFNITNLAPPGWTAEAMPDYCSVFEGPFDNHAIGKITTPSLSAIFHGFTIAYIAIAVGTNPYKPIGGISFLILLGCNAILNLFYRYSMMCDTIPAAIIGIIVGAALGAGWWALIKSTRPDWLFYGDDKQSKKCKLGKTKFKCVYE